MIERYYSCFTAVCDYCGKRLPGSESFKGTLRDMLDAGWESRKNGDDWKCVCNDCLFTEKGYDEDMTRRSGLLEDD